MRQRFVLVGDTFPPLRTSGAVQLRDLSREFARQGAELTVLLPSAGLDRPWRLEDFEGVRVLRLRSPKTKDIGYVRRTLGELLMPFFMRWNLRRSPFSNTVWQGVIWYSPSIFFAPLIRSLKRRGDCKSYLIIRDIFPEWAADMGLMTRGFAYRFFRLVAAQQYAAADTIGVQSPGNLPYFENWQRRGKQVEVLQNWLGAAGRKPCPISLSGTPLAGATVFVYAGNMGVAQGMDTLLGLCERMRDRDDVGFLFVGRGSEAERMAQEARARGLYKVLVRDEIDPDEIPALYEQCHVGLVALDARHKSHNIPGKFLTYLQCGLPVLATVNPRNDLARLIREERVGRVTESNSVEELFLRAEELLADLRHASDLSASCRSLFRKLFAADAAARQVMIRLAPECAQRTDAGLPATPTSNESQARL
jgi:glycosyltransferase involved in cell wall biosynthesis